MDKLHCPECGKEGRPVGGTFRAPAKRDDKGWKSVKQSLDSGKKFIYCLTVEDSEEIEIKKEGKLVVDRLLH